MRIVKVSAYLRNNLGDDMFIEILLKRYPNVVFYFNENPDYLAFLKRYKNSRYISKEMVEFSKLLFKLLKKDLIYVIKRHFDKAEAVIRIGGSIYMQVGQEEYEPVLRRDNQALFIIGANFGPYLTQGYLNSVRNEISSSNDCCFRDKWSYSMFRDVSIVRFAPDLLWGYKLPSVREIPKSVGISVIDLTNRTQLCEKKDFYLELLSTLCRKLNKDNYRVTLYSFCDYEGDYRAINDIRERISDISDVRCIVYDGKTKRFLKDFCANEYIIGTRFHSMLLGWSSRRKVVPIIYNNKMKNVIEDVGYKGFTWDLLSGQLMTADDLLHGMLSTTPLNNIEYYKSESVHQFDSLDRYLDRI